MANPVGERSDSVAVRGVAIAACTQSGIEAAKQFLERAREVSTFRLAQFLFLADQPGNLDHPPLTLVGQMAVEGILAALEYGELAVERRQFRGCDAVDVVDLVQETQAAVTAAKSCSRSAH